MPGRGPAGIPAERERLDAGEQHGELGARLVGGLPRSGDFDPDLPGAQPGGDAQRDVLAVWRDVQAGAGAVAQAVHGAGRVCAVFPRGRVDGAVQDAHALAEHFGAEDLSRVAERGLDSRFADDVPESRVGLCPCLPVVQFAAVHR